MNKRFLADIAAMAARLAVVTLLLVSVVGIGCRPRNGGTEPTDGSAPPVQPANDGSDQVPSGEKLASHDQRDREDRQQTPGQVAQSATPPAGNPILTLGKGAGDGFGGDIDPDHAEVLTFDPTGSMLAVGYRSNEVRVWDVVKGTQLFSLKGHEHPPCALRYTPDGSLLSCDRAGTVITWDAMKGRKTATLQLASKEEFLAASIAEASFSPDGKLLVVAGIDGAGLFNVSTGKLIAGFPVTPPNEGTGVSSIAFRSDGKAVATGGGGGTIDLWDCPTGRHIRTLSGHDARPVTSVAFSADGNRLVSSCCDGTVKSWDTAGGTNLATGKGHTNYVLAVSATHDGKGIISGGEDGTIRFWDDRASSVATLKAFPGNQVRTLSLSPDGKYLAAKSFAGQIKVWGVADALKHGSVSVDPRVKWNLGHTEPIYSVAFSADGKTLAGAGPHTVQLWSVATGMGAMQLTPDAGGIQCISFAPDGTLAVASSGVGGSVQLWNINDTSPKRLIRLGDEKEEFKSVAISRDGEKLVAAEWRTKQIHVWERATGKRLTTLSGHTGTVHTVAFSPDGTQVASGGFDRTVRLWDVKSGKNTLTLEGRTGTIHTTAYTPDGKLLASGGEDGVIQIWDLTTGKVTAELKGHSKSINAVAFSLDGSVLASAGLDQHQFQAAAVRLWDAKTGKTIAALEGHRWQVTCLAFSRDGSLLASGSEDATVRVWSLTTVPMTTEAK